MSSIPLQGCNSIVSDLGHPFSTPRHPYGRRASALIERLCDPQRNGITPDEAMRRRECLIELLGNLWESISGDPPADHPPIASAPSDWTPPSIAAHYLSDSLWSHLDRPVNDLEVIRRAKDYLSMPWARDPHLDWIFLSTLLFTALRADLLDLRAVLVTAATGKIAAIPDNLRAKGMPDLQIHAARGMLFRNVKAALIGAAAVVGASFILVEGLGQPDPNAATWAITAVAALALAVAGAAGLLWATQLAGRVFIGKNAADAERPAAKLTAAIRDIERAAKLYDEFGRGPVSTRRLREVIIPAIASNHLAEPVLVALADRLIAEGPVFVPFPN